jgi:hypothetical protein
MVPKPELLFENEGLGVAEFLSWPGKEWVSAAQDFDLEVIVDAMRFADYPRVRNISAK